jgi:hypothetical protein
MATLLYIGAGSDAVPLVHPGVRASVDRLLYVDDLSHRFSAGDTIVALICQLEAYGVEYDHVRKTSANRWEMDVAGKPLVYLAGVSDQDLVEPDAPYVDLLAEVTALWIDGFAPWEDDARGGLHLLPRLRALYMQDSAWMQELMPWLAQLPPGSVQRSSLPAGVFFAPEIPFSFHLGEDFGERYVRLEGGRWREFDPAEEIVALAR